VNGRPDEIAAALGGEARCFYDLRISRKALVPARYALSALRTILYLAIRRPRALIVTNPPIFPAIIAYPYARLARVPLLLDSHPDAFRSEGVHSRFLRIHAWLARRARATLVTSDNLSRRVESWGGRAIIVHEAPPERVERVPAGMPSRPLVLVLGSLSVDEPVDDVLEAARHLPEVDFEVTGDTTRCPPDLVASAPDNVVLLGYLGARDYARALQRASIVVVLTRWLEWAVPRSAYDAVYASRPLVLSASPILRELFPYAVHVGNSAESVAAGIREAIARHEELVVAAEDALRLQSSRWDGQLEDLRTSIGARRA
jgi:glycosyltransferase involved in cell wall biosynthesis